MFAISVGDQVEKGLARFFEYVPQLIGALILLIIGVIIAKLLQKIVVTALHGVGFDRGVEATPIGSYVERMVKSPAAFVSRVTYWLVFLAFLSFSLAALNLPVLDRAINSVYAYIPHIFAAIVIFVVAGAVSTGAVAFVRTTMGATPTAKLISAVIPSITMGIAVFMILDELNIAENIVNTTFNAIMYSIALGLALAFGLGGRDVAKKMLDQAYDAGQRNAASAKHDVKKAKKRTEDKIDEVR